MSALIENKKLLSAARVVAKRQLSTIPSGIAHSDEIIAELPAAITYVKDRILEKEVTLALMLAITIVRSNFRHIETLALYKKFSNENR